MLTSHLSSSCISFLGIHEPGILALASPPTRCHVCSVNTGKPWSLFGLVRGSATRSNSLAQVSTDMAPSSSCFYFRRCRARAWLWGLGGWEEGAVSLLDVAPTPTQSAFLGFPPALPMPCQEEGGFSGSTWVDSLQAP